MLGRVRYNIIIRDRIVVDRTRSPFRADIGIVGNTITAMKDLSDAEAEITIVCSGSI